MVILLIKINTEPILIDFLKENGMNKIFRSFEEVDYWLFENNLDENKYQHIIIEKTNDLQSILHNFIEQSVKPIETLADDM